MPKASRPGRNIDEDQILRSLCGEHSDSDADEAVRPGGAGVHGSRKRKRESSADAPDACAVPSPPLVSGPACSLPACGRPAVSWCVGCSTPEQRVHLCRDPACFDAAHPVVKTHRIEALSQDAVAPPPAAHYKPPAAADATDVLEADSQPVPEPDAALQPDAKPHPWASVVPREPTPQPDGQTAGNVVVTPDSCVPEMLVCAEADVGECGKPGSHVRNEAAPEKLTRDVVSASAHATKPTPASLPDVPVCGSACLARLTRLDVSALTTFAAGIVERRRASVNLAHEAQQRCAERLVACEAQLAAGRAPPSPHHPSHLALPVQPPPACPPTPRLQQTLAKYLAMLKLVARIVKHGAAGHGGRALAPARHLLS